MIGFGQTLIPDANFEPALINLGYDTGAPNGSVPTTNINTVDTLSINNLGISNLSGIEDFSSLLYLSCSSNQLTSLDLSQNTALIYLMCSNNLIANLDVSQCLYLEQLRCDMNKLTVLDLSPNINLKDELYLTQNELTSLNIKNGSNHLIVNNQFSIANNPDLYCLEVDDPVYSDATWFNIDPQHDFALSCATSVEELYNTKNELINITDVLGRETKQTNQPLFYIYDDGTVDKRIVIE
jgi:hypothetical protein